MSGRLTLKFECGGCGKSWRGQGLKIHCHHCGSRDLYVCNADPLRRLPSGLSSGPLFDWAKQRRDGGGENSVRAA